MQQFLQATSGCRERSCPVSASPRAPRTSDYSLLLSTPIRHKPQDHQGVPRSLGNGSLSFGISLGIDTVPPNALSSKPVWLCSPFQHVHPTSLALPGSTKPSRVLPEMDISYGMLWNARLLPPHGDDSIEASIHRLQTVFFCVTESLVSSFSVWIPLIVMLSPLTTSFPFYHRTYNLVPSYRLHPPYPFEKSCRSSLNSHCFDQ